MFSLALVFNSIALYGCSDDNSSGTNANAHHYAPNQKSDTDDKTDSSKEASPTEDPNQEFLQKKEAFETASVTRIKTQKQVVKTVKLKWKKVEEATGYEIYRSRKKNSGYQLLDTVTSQKYTDKRVKQRKEYYYKIKAVTSINNENVSSKESKSVKIYVLPEKPKTVIIGECFAVAMERERRRMPSYFHYVGRAGMSTYTMLSNNEFNYNGTRINAFEKAATYRPDRIIFFVGANYSGSIDPAKSAALFLKMKKMMNNLNPHVQFVIMAVSPWKKNSRYGRILASHDKRHRINSAYKKVAKKNKDLYYCNLTEKMEDRNGDLRYEFNSGDGLHWSNTARYWMVNNLKKWCKKHLGSW